MSEKEIEERIEESLLSPAQQRDVRDFKRDNILTRLSYDELRGIKRIFSWQARDRRLESDKLVAQMKVDYVQEEMDKRNS